MSKDHANCIDRRGANAYFRFSVGVGIIIGQVVPSRLSGVVIGVLVVLAAFVLRALEIDKEER